ncbi:MAG: UDP-N-acetylmuramate dehydrogenase [Candidatus Eremiobacteraeota bacterium]|nr:UDP-N-acetylmuramate dehydrogenase [Candidatus Eremiobacteraeota bacterium]
MSRAEIRENVELAPMTTLGVGGAAQYFSEVKSPAELLETIRWAKHKSQPLYVLGGGSNLLVSDAGFPGLVVRYVDDRLERLETNGDRVWLRVGAGKNWDELVAQTVAWNLAGIECLSGIPGLVGAAPIQNIGAYGQEVAEVIESVEVIERSTGELHLISKNHCGFGYRDSHFKGKWNGLYIVVAVHLRLVEGGQPSIRYGDLTRRLGPGRPTLQEVRDTVLEVRRSKSMVYDTRDPNHRSAGSFFTNPIVEESLADEVDARFAKDAMPRYPAEGGVKLSAAWLIERAGFEKGFVLGQAGLSSNHVLALINRGGAQAEDLLNLAKLVRRQVLERTGVTLVPEPNLLGFGVEAFELIGRA